MQLCARCLEKAGSPVTLQFVRCHTLRLCQCVALPHTGGNVPENGVALGLSEPSCKTSSTGNEPLLPQLGGSVPVRGISVMTRKERFGHAPGCAHVWSTVPANTSHCIGGKSAFRLKGWVVHEMLLVCFNAGPNASESRYLDAHTVRGASQPSGYALRPFRLCTAERIRHAAHKLHLQATGNVFGQGAHKQTHLLCCTHTWLRYPVSDRLWTAPLRRQGANLATPPKCQIKECWECVGPPPARWKGACKKVVNKL